MSASAEAVARPFAAFNFAVEIRVPELFPHVCSAAFSECDGLEMTIEAKTIKEGGNNGRLFRVPGVAGYGQLTLKRGMTETFDIWEWAAATVEDPQLRGDGEVVIFAIDGSTEQARFILQRCLPVKVKAPALNAKDGIVAIEELQLAYESLKLRRPGGGGV